MKGFNDIRKGNRKKNTRLITLLIVILIIVMALLAFIYIDFSSGLKVAEENGVYTVYDVGKKYSHNDNYNKLIVGEDLPEGYYSVYKGSNSSYDNVEIEVDFGEEITEQLLNYEVYVPSDFNFDIDTQIDNIYLPKGSSVIIDSGYNTQDIVFTKLEEPQKFDPNQLDKVGIYETNDNQITLPLELFEKIYKIELYSFSDNEMWMYSCKNDYQCSYGKENLTTGDVREGDIDVIDSLVQNNKELTLDLLDKSYIIIESLL